MSRLRDVVQGRVIAPGDSEYDGARAVFYSGFDRRPAAIVRPSDAADVVRAVSLARDAGAPLAVRSGGHSPAGHGVVDKGIVLDLSSLKQLELDLTSRTAWAQTGLTAGEFTSVASGHGLAVGFGDSPSVGIGGITLGGGVGFLHRSLGLTIDSVLAAEIVTADGRMHHVDADAHPDLFWAIRGGGGNFGVVTRFRFRLHEVEAVTGGMLIQPATPEGIVRFIAALDEAPETLSGVVGVLLAPPMPLIPAEQHGQPILFASLVHVGAPGEGERVLAPLRSIATPIADLLRPMRYVEIYEGAEPPRPACVEVRSFFADGVDRAAAEAALDALHRSRAPMRVAQFRVLGGAVSRVPADATAFAHRGRRLMCVVAAAYGDAAEAAEHEEWASGLAAELRTGDRGAYVGFLGNVGEARVREAYPAPVWNRLRRVKAEYDPTNLFRFNQNLPPA